MATTRYKHWSVYLRCNAGSGANGLKIDPVVGEGELTWPEVVRDFQRAGRAGLQKIYREDEPGQFSLHGAPMPRFDLLTNTSPDPSKPQLDPHTTGALHR